MGMKRKRNLTKTNSEKEQKKLRLKENEGLKEALATVQTRVSDLERENSELTKALTVSETQSQDLQVERNNLLRLVEKALEQKNTQITWTRNTVTSSTLESRVHAIEEKALCWEKISELETVNINLTEKLSIMKNILRKSIESAMEENRRRKIPRDIPKVRSAEPFDHSRITSEKLNTSLTSSLNKIFK